MALKETCCFFTFKVVIADIGIYSMPLFLAGDKDSLEEEVLYLSGTFLAKWGLVGGVDVAQEVERSSTD